MNLATAIVTQAQAANASIYLYITTVIIVETIIRDELKQTVTRQN